MPVDGRGFFAMRILYISEAKFPSRAANTTQIQAMCAAFVRAGYQVDLIGLNEMPARLVQRSENPAGFAVHLLRWPWRRLRNRMVAAIGRRLARRLKPDLIFTRSALLAKAMVRQGTPIILELHSLPPGGSRLESALQRVLISHTLIKVVCISQGLADDLKAAYPEQRNGLDVMVAHDGADPGPEPTPREPMEGRRFRIGYFGHLYPGKGMELIAELAPIVPEAEFHIYGGTEKDIARWRSEKLASNIQLHGHIPHAEVRQRMEWCDALIAPYGKKVEHVAGGDIGRWMSPLKLFEYMSAGRPILASDLSTIREVLQDRVHALLCDPENPDTWKATVITMMGDELFAGSIGSNGRQLLLEIYTWDARTEAVLKMPRR